MPRLTFSSDPYDVPSSANRDSRPSLKARCPHNPRDTILVLPALRPSEIQEAVQDACKTYVQQLKIIETRANVAVVAYRAGARICCPLHPARQPARIIRALEQEWPTPGADLGIALSAAETVAEYARHPFHIVLMVAGRDAWATRTISYAAKLQQRAVIDCVGIGENPADVDHKFCCETRALSSHFTSFFLRDGKVRPSAGFCSR